RGADDSEASVGLGGLQGSETLTERLAGRRGQRPNGDHLSIGLFTPLVLPGIPFRVDDAQVHAVARRLVPAAFLLLPRQKRKREVVPVPVIATRRQHRGKREDGGEEGSVHGGCDVQGGDHLPWQRAAR